MPACFHMLGRIVWSVFCFMFERQNIEQGTAIEAGIPQREPPGPR